jgi:hypothetical protein
MRRVRIALAAGLALLAVAIGLTLVHSPSVLARKSGTAHIEDRIATTTHGATYCQAGELLPARTSAIRLSLGADTGPRVVVRITTGGREIAGGTQGSGWTGRVVTVPLKPLARAIHAATVCASFQLRDERVTAFGQASSRTTAAYDGPHPLGGRMLIEYLRPGTRSWASLAPSTARRLGLGRVVSGTWNALLVLELLATIVVLSSTLVLKELP